MEQGVKEVEFACGSWKERKGTWGDYGGIGSLQVLVVIGFKIPYSQPSFYTCLSRTTKKRAET